MLELALPQIDCPIAGVAFFGLATWGLLHDAATVEDALRLLVLAERFAYNRSIPTMAWEQIAPEAESRAPGRLAELLASADGLRPRELLGDAREVVAALSS